jgi:cysteine desulfurase family protein (TIGR01976 family)
MDARFPGLADGWARFDGPGGTQMLGTAIDAMAAYLRDGRNANTHGDFAASEATTALQDRTRHIVGRLLNADPAGVVFGANMTSLTFAFTRVVAATLQPGDEIVCTRLDHDANVTPWVRAARDAGATVRLAPFDATTGRLDPGDVAALIGPRTRWVAVAGASNALGTIPDVAAVASAARGAGARTFVDGVHLVPHRPVDVGSLDCDVLVTSPYKWYGPHAGVMCAKPELLAELDAYKVRPAPDDGPGRYETGTPSFEALAAIEVAASFLIEQGMETIAKSEMAVFAPLLKGLLAMNHVVVHGPRDLDARTPTVTFSVAGVAPDEVARRLAQDRVAVWSGNYYAVEVMQTLGLPDGAVRAGAACYTTPDDVDRLLDSVSRLVTF